MARISFVVVGKTLYHTKACQDFWDGAKIKPQNPLKRNSWIWLLICPVNIQGSYSDTPGFFFHSFCCLTFANCINTEGLTLFLLLFFFKQKCILFWETYFLRFLKIQLPQHFFAEVYTKKHKCASANASNAALVKLTDWIIKNDHVINCAMFFCKWFKHGQTSNVIWLSTTWLLIFRLEVANKKPLLTLKPVRYELKFPVKKI